jgi:aminopeptidase
VEDPDYAAIAAKLLRNSLRVKPQERVTIIGRTDSLDFCEALELECRRIRAYPFVIVSSDNALLATLKDPVIETQDLTRPSPQLLAALKDSDIIITTFFDRADPRAFQPPHILPERLIALRQSEEASGDIIFDGSRRWLGTEVPTPEQAAALGCSWETLHTTYWAAMKADYDTIGRQALALKARLVKTDVVRLLDDNGTDLIFETGGRPIECDDGVISDEDIEQGALYLNMPSGEVCFAPPETSANGRVYIEIAFWLGQRIKGLELEFKNGVVEAIKASEGLEIFREALASGGRDGAKLGEFGIGLNPAVERVIGFTLLDEKIYGTAHLALGENRPLGGTNNSAIHWDLVLPGVTVLADGEPLVKNGRVLV